MLGIVERGGILPDVLIPSISLAVVGAPYPNADGSDRQFEIKLCSPGDPVELRPEPKNKYDEHAVAVFSERNTQLGYISSERAVQLGVLWRNGHRLSAIFQQETEWGAVVRIGIDQEPTLPEARPAATHEMDTSDPDSGFYPDWIPPDD